MRSIPMPKGASRLGYVESSCLLEYFIGSKTKDQCYQVASVAGIADADKFHQVIEVSIQWDAL